MHTASTQPLSKSGKDPGFVSENDFRYHLSIDLHKRGKRHTLSPFFSKIFFTRMNEMVVQSRLLLLASCVALLTACGGGGGGSSSPAAVASGSGGQTSTGASGSSSSSSTTSTLPGA